MTPAPWKLWEGQVVDSCFPLRRYLGGGERSAVYLTQFGDAEPRDAAIKLVLAETMEADPSEQWARVAQLSHPNLLRLLRTGRWQVNQFDLRYAVTEYAEENLAEVLTERPLTATEVRDLMQPLIGALAYIHSEGMVHGHLKPANLMAAGDDLKLSVDSITLVGEPGAAPGTPGPYDPPEFADRGCSPGGDVWSFGVTLVEALTQQLPTPAGAKQEPGLPASLPSEFAPIVRACLRPDPRRRASLDEVRELFMRPEPATPAVVAAAPVRDPVAGSRKWVGATLVLAAAVAFGGILAAPRLLHRPVANAQTEPVAAAPVTSIPEPPKVAEPTPVEVKPPIASPPEPDPTPVEPPPTTTPKPEPPPARTREHVVEATSGDVVRQVLPEIPDYARRTIRGAVKIQVRAAVDAAGHVTEANIESQNSKYFAKLTLEAARKWDFAPGPSTWLLRFEYTTAGATVRPTRVSH